MIIMKTTDQQQYLPTDAEKLNLANTLITALKNNDWDTMLTILEPDAAWTLPGTSVLSGVASGANAIVNRFQGLKGFGVKFQLKYILYGLQGFTLSLHNTAERSGLILDEQVAIVCQVNAAGKVSAMATYLSDVEGINGFFIPGILS